MACVMLSNRTTRRTVSQISPIAAARKTALLMRMPRTLPIRVKHLGR